MTEPAVAVEVAFPTDPLSVPGGGDWTNITEWTDAFSTHRGRQHELQRTEPGEAAIELDNADRRFDPTHTTGPYYPNVLPMRHIRIRATHNAQTYDLFRGFVQSWPQSWDDLAEVRLQAVDAFGLLNLFDLTAYSEEVRADGPLGYWRFRETSGITATDEANHSSGPFNGTYSGVTLNVAGPLYGGSGAAQLRIADNSFITVGTVAPALLTGDLTLEIWYWPFGESQPATVVSTIPGAGGNYPYQITAVGLGPGNGHELEYRHVNAAGMCTIKPSGAPALATQTWHHVVIRRKGNRVDFWIDGVRYPGNSDICYPIETPAGCDLRLCRRADGTEGSNANLGQAAIYDYALADDRIRAHHAAGFDTFIAQPTGAHIGAILDAIGWPVGERSLDTGNSTIQETTPSGNALQHLLKVAEESENGLLFVGGDGKISFHERHSLWKAPHNTPQATFGDDPGAGERPYEVLALSYDTEDLWNGVRVEREGGVPQQVQDATSRENYGPRDLPPKTGLLISSDLEALDAATYLLTRYKEPAVRPTRVRVEGQEDDDATWTQILARDIHHDRITIKRRPPGGGAAIVQDAHIEGVSHAVRSPTDWSVTWELVPSDALTYWLLGDSTYGVLGSTTRLGY